MKTRLTILLCTVVALTAHAHENGPRADLYACEGCEAATEVDPKTLSWSTRVASDTEPGVRLLLTGTLYLNDGATPAPDVVVYMHQTNAEGEYVGGDPDNRWSRRHGHLRAWVRSDANGRYRFETIRPGTYPNRQAPAHIHLTIAEPGRPPYYLDDVVFADDPAVTSHYLRRQSGRGGRGVVTLVSDSNGSLIAVRDIVLERHPD